MAYFWLFFGDNMLNLNKKKIYIIMDIFGMTRCLFADVNKRYFRVQKICRKIKISSNFDEAKITNLKNKAFLLA
jgi:hypothetical protein